jgi:hypothetical protein
VGEEDGKAPLAKVVDEGVSSKFVEDVGEAPPTEDLVEACRCGLPKMFVKGPPVKCVWRR